MYLNITCAPGDPHFKEFCSHPGIQGIRMNGLLFKAVNLKEELSKIPVTATVPLWLDAKGRQLRVEEAIEHPDHLELVLNHGISGLSLPHPIIFKAGEDWAMVEKITDENRRLHLRADGHPKYRVRAGDSIHFRDQELRITDTLFTRDEKSKIEQAVKAGFKGFYLSYVESARDVDEFRELVGKEAALVLKIESRKGLEFVRKDYGRRFGTDWMSRLCCARGDLYVEVEQPHEILEAQRLIIQEDPYAIVGSRLLLSLFNNNVPTCSDVCEIGLLRALGYKYFLLCDDLCKKSSSLHRAVDTFNGMSSHIKPFL